MKKFIKNKLFRFFCQVQILYSYLWIKFTRTDKWTYRERSKLRNRLFALAFKFMDIEKTTVTEKLQGYANTPEGITALCSLLR